ncbi:ras-like protein family member 10A [Ambystoma mexicanum]|uniref:ras-like protein family member 10A n=1 Tax=Ambystoma mexicanum TaxID=8296 RepID=UPI0037E8B2DE
MDMVETLKVAVLGAPGVGKTAIIRQFVHHDFSEVYNPTSSQDVYRPSVILNGAMFDLKITDVPKWVAFPVNGSQEWSDLKCCVLRDTCAYILVYDICSLESFEYVKTLRLKILENRTGLPNEMPIIVVGNKRDQQKHRFTSRRTVSLLVKKSWKCGYIECSAKYNWHIVLLFKELLMSAAARNCKHSHSSTRLQGALQRNSCSIM